MEKQLTTPGQNHMRVTQTNTSMRRNNSGSTLLGALRKRRWQRIVICALAWAFVSSNCVLAWHAVAHESERIAVHSSETPTQIAAHFHNHCYLCQFAHGYSSTPTTDVANIRHVQPVPAAMDTAFEPLTPPVFYRPGARGPPTTLPL
ncbi:MAG: hypothetical protein L0H83_05435 [Salinisphaera sp.]|nr:hypothetical protein [Salinisphaera sp.]